MTLGFHYIIWANMIFHKKNHYQNNQRNVILMDTLDFHTFIGFHAKTQDHTII